MHLDLDGYFNGNEKRSTRTVVYIFSSRSQQTFHDRQTKVITQTEIFRISPDKSNSRFPICNNLILATLLILSLHCSHFISKRKQHFFRVFSLFCFFGFLSLFSCDDKSLPSSQPVQNWNTWIQYIFGCYPQKIPCAKWIKKIKKKSLQLIRKRVTASDWEWQARASCHFQWPRWKSLPPANVVACVSRCVFFLLRLLYFKIGITNANVMNAHWK